MSGPLGGAGGCCCSPMGVPVPPPVVPISDAFWSTGGWWDLQSIAGAPGSAYTTPTASTSAGGLGLFTPGFFVGPATPTIYDTAIGGKRGLVTSQVADNFLENDALAPIANGTSNTFTIVFDYQQNNLGVPLIANCIAAWGAAGGIGAQNHLKFYYTGTSSGGSTAQGLVVVQSTTPAFTETQNNIAPVVAYDYFRFAASYNGVHLSTYINGALVAVVPTTLAAAVMAVTKFMWGAWPVNGVGYEASNGYIRRLGVRALATSPADIATIDANMVANDYTLPQTDPATPKIVFGGASQMFGSHDLTTGMGWRYDFAVAVQNGRRSWTTTGTGQGFYALRNTVAVAGMDAPTIASTVVAALDARTRIVAVDLGDEEIDLNQNTAAVQAAIAGAITTIRNGIASICPQAVLVLNTIVPFSEPALNAVCIATNAQLPTIWANSNAAFPLQLPIADWDANGAVGGPAYVQANFTPAGDDHLNSTGYRLAGAAQMVVVAPYMALFSPT